MTQEEADAMVDKMAAILFEHFEGVQIMVSWQEPTMTMMSSRGIGNAYTRLGMAREYIKAFDRGDNWVEDPPDDMKGGKSVG